MSYLMAMDQGTSSSRSIIMRTDGSIVSMAQQPLHQIYPQPGWVEHDPDEIWQSQLNTARQAISQAGINASSITSLGITNQRETTVVWRRDSGHPIHNAIVWQDRRTAPVCQVLIEQGAASLIQQKTGLLIDAYFSATKLQWILNNVAGARAMAERGELAFGTVDSWLMWQLSGGAVHATDVSNAARTMLFNIHTNQWDDELLQLLDIPASVLPRVQPSASDFGLTQSQWLGHALPIGGVAGDQQSALFGQACFSAGQVKNTYGTGCFMLMHTGDHFQTSRNGLITTSAAQADSTPAYALEGSVFIGGAVVQWLRDGLRAFDHSADVQQLAETVSDAGGVVLVPAFTGLGAPYWQADARGTMVGLSRGTTMAHIARAALESIAFQSTALLQAMNRDAKQAVAELRVDGGACVNDLLMQFQADLLGIPVLRPQVIETTALGAAYLAGLTAGIYQSPQEIAQHWRVERQFEPQMSSDQAESLMAHWEKAVRQTIAH
ncbi:MAG: glycerol kinase [Betaproteobacteria bacterium]|nr:glycerol kinase [Betaproteobacteria bacterium]